jgi:hypothetical protein
VHIFTASKQPWVVLPAGTPAVPGYYRADELWPAASLARRAAAIGLVGAAQAGDAGAGRR